MITAIIPARGNSKEIDEKNIARFGGGFNLLQLAVRSAVKSKYIDYIVVTSESERVKSQAIKMLSPMAKSHWEVLDRPHELSQDIVQVDEVVLYTIRQLNYINTKPDTVVVLQPTSPFRTTTHIDDAIELYNLVNDKKPWEEKETLVSVTDVGQIYESESKGTSYFVPNYYIDDPRYRLGRQQADSDHFAMENGAIYIADVKKINKYRSFRSIDIVPYWMGKWESLEIDSETDLAVADFLLKGNYASIS